jgi:hypothetical protein
VLGDLILEYLTPSVNAPSGFSQNEPNRYREDTKYPIMSSVWALWCFLGILLCSLSGNHPYEDVKKMAIILRKI